jgi:hypothetical protein
MFMSCDSVIAACKHKQEPGAPSSSSSATPDPSLDLDPRPPAAKKARFVFTDIQRRTLKAIFKETPRPTKEMQTTIAEQLGLEVNTVANFFMNARRRSHDKWVDENGHSNLDDVSGDDNSN